MTATLRLLQAHLGIWRWRLAGRPRVGDRGEGVISAAIAVLIMAFLGAAMWIGFNQIWQDAERTTSDNVEEIGR